MSRIVVIPLACIVNPVFLDPLECKRKLGLSGKRLVTMFGFVGYPKGHDMAITAMKNTRMPADVVLYVAGEGRVPADIEYELGLRRRVLDERLTGRIRFHGYVSDEDVPVVMCASDIVLLPYRHVVQSGAVNYPLAYRIPVLASDIGGFAEIANEYGCIETFRHEDQEDLEDKLLSLLSSPRACMELVEKSRRYVADVGLEKICSVLGKVYTMTEGE